TAGMVPLAGLLAACRPPLAWETAPVKIPRVGVLAFGSPGQPSLLDAFEQGLTDQGYTHGKNIIIEYRFAEGKLERFPTLAADLVNLPVDVILAALSPAIEAAVQATRTIPIIMGVSSEPVEQGFVVSLHRPGGNVTGLTSMSLLLSQKRVEVLQD